MNSEIPNMYIFIKMKLTNKAKNLDVSSKQLSFELISSFTHETNPFGRIRVKHDELGHSPNPSTQISFLHFSFMFKFFDISKISEGNWLISYVTLQPILDNDTHFFSNSSRYSWRCRLFPLFPWLITLSRSLVCRSVHFAEQQTNLLVELSWLRSFELLERVSIWDFQTFEHPSKTSAFKLPKRSEFHFHVFCSSSLIVFSKLQQRTINNSLCCCPKPIC